MNYLLARMQTTMKNALFKMESMLKGHRLYLGKQKRHIKSNLPKKIIKMGSLCLKSNKIVGEKQCHSFAYIPLSHGISAFSSNISGCASHRKYFFRVFDFIFTLPIISGYQRFDCIRA